MGSTPLWVTIVTAIISAAVGGAVKLLGERIFDLWSIALSLLGKDDLPDLAGEHLSQWCWLDDKNQEQPKAERVVVKQFGRSVWGESKDGTYEYTFKGRVFADTVLGEWKSKKKKLAGVFQLLIDREVENDLIAQGQWIGNGNARLHSGTWIWRKPSKT